MVMSIADERPDQQLIDDRARSVAHLFIDRVARTPYAEAFQYPSEGTWKSISWKQTDRRVRHIAGGLIALGVQLEDRVAIAASTSLQWVLADLGIMLAGGATTTIYPTSTTSDIAYILADSGSKVVFAEGGEQLARLREVREDIPDASHVVTFAGTDDPSESVLSLSQLEERGATYLAQHPDAIEERVQALTPQHLATLIYTSGTTGRPKGVLLPHDAWVYEAASVDSVHLLSADDLQYLWLPLAHVFGKMLLTLPLQIGFPTAVDGRVDKIVENLPLVRPTWMGAAPRIFEKVYGRITTMMADEGGAKAKLFAWAGRTGTQVATRRAAGAKIPAALALQHKVGDALVLSKVRERFGGRIRFFISGSASLNRDVARWFDAIGTPVLEGYGLTETSAACTVNRPYANQIGTVGWPLPGTQVTIADDGEVLVKGPGVMQGYRGLADETATVLVDGWFHTGDIGELTPTGHLKITDRKKDLFKTSNGKYVAPGQIEATFKGLCPYASQLVIEGDGRKFVSALITLDEEAIVDWAKGGPLEGKDYTAIVTSDAVRQLVQEYVDQLNSQLNRWEQIKKFSILPRDLTVEDGEITPSLKLKRRVVIGKFKDQLDEFYQD